MCMCMYTRCCTYHRSPLLSRNGLHSVVVGCGGSIVVVEIVVEKEEQRWQDGPEQVTVATAAA